MPNFSQIDDKTKPHLLNLIEWLGEEVLRSGGDGDGVWYSRYYSIQDILPLVEQVNKKVTSPTE